MNFKIIQVFNYSSLTKGRNFGLDFIRSVAILLVLIAHLGVDEKSTLGIKIGSLGVEIFFVLSGFLIGQIVIREFSKELSFNSIKNFWIRRWFRTLPLYYTVLLMKFIFINHTIGIKVFVYFLFLQNNFVGVDFFPASWSLVIEEWFYLLLPVFMLIYFYRRPVNGNTLIFFLLFFIVAENLLRVVWVLTTNKQFEGINGNFPFRLDSLMCGVLIACLKLNFFSVYKRLTTNIVFILILVIYLSLLLFVGQLTLNDTLNNRIWTRTVWFLLNSAFIAGLIPFVEEKLIIKSKLLVYLFSCISIFSYSAYLIHTEVFNLLMTYNFFSIKWLYEALASVVVTFFISGLVYGFFEKPITELRNSFGKLERATQ